MALDEKYMSADEFSDGYELGGRIRAATSGFINYLRKYEERKAANPCPEP